MDSVRPDEFASFMRAYQDMVFTTAARITGSERHAEDISQEVFLKAYESFAQLQSSQAVGGWLRTVATNLSLNHLSRYRRRWRFFSELRRDDGDEEGEAFDPGFTLPDGLPADLDADNRRELIEQALMRLPEHQRVPLVLYHFGELPYEEIAAQLHVSLAKVKTDIFRARAALAKVLARSGITQASDVISS